MSPWKRAEQAKKKKACKSPKASNEPRAVLNGPGQKTRIDENGKRWYQDKGGDWYSFLGLKLPQQPKPLEQPLV